MGILDNLLDIANPDLIAKFKQAFKFEYTLKQIHNDDEWAKLTEDGQGFWGIFTTDCLFFSYTKYKKNWQFGRLPKDAAIYKNTDGTMVMFAIEANLTEEDVNRIFIRLNSEAKPVTALEDIAKELDVYAQYYAKEANPMGPNGFVYSQEFITRKLNEIIECAYDGIIVHPDKLILKIKNYIDFVTVLESAEECEYEYPEGYTLETYRDEIKHIIYLAVVHAHNTERIEYKDEETQQTSTWFNPAK